MSEKVIAKVNGSPVSETDFNNAVQGYAMELHRKTMDSLSVDELAAVEDLAVDKLIARELIYQEALSQGVVATADAVAAEIERLLKNFSSPEDLYATLAKAGIDQAAYQRMIRQDLTVNLLTDQQVASLPEPDNAQIEAIFQAHPEQMKKPARVRASHILLKVREGERDATRQQMVELQKRCHQENFAELARDVSDCPSGARGGDLGYFKQGDMVKSFSEAAFSQPIGEVGEIVESPFGFHLILVTGREEGTSLTLEEATPKISQYLKGESAARHLKAWVDDLKSRASIEML